MPDNIYLKGNFLSIKYYAPVYDRLQKEFQLALPLSEQSNRWLERISKTNSVSLHVRRTDYVNNPKTSKFHSVLGLEYYARAVAWMQDKLEQPEFYVFSDDQEWARAHIKTPGSSTYYVDCNNADNGYQDFHLMRNCRSHIIANSGFSRWAAYLNSNPNKQVCMPSRWFSEERIGDSDVAPESWVRIDNQTHG